MKDYVCVIGGTNVDISSKAYNSLILHDSNPSKTTLTAGGVGRNVAENLARLKVKTEFITVFGNDFYAAKLQDGCRKLGIGVDYALCADAPTSTYLCVNDEKGDMFIGASDMEILNAIDENFLRGKLEILNGAKAVAVDTNLSRNALKFVFSECKAPVFVETVSVNKIKKLLNLTGGAFAIKPNVYEAEVLSGMKIKSEKDLPLAASALHERGYKNVVITLGEKGSFYSDGTESGVIKKTADKIVNTTGAGDAFFAALIYGYINGYDLKSSCGFGNKAAVMALSCGETVNSNLSAEKLLIN